MNNMEMLDIAHDMSMKAQASTELAHKLKADG
jgi:hypothetical protein